jgi:hypothetical protein
MNLHRTLVSRCAVLTLVPHHLQMKHGRVLLLPAIAAEEPVYVNAKQFNGILRRRLARARAARDLRASRSRKVSSRASSILC